MNSDQTHSTQRLSSYCSTIAQYWNGFYNNFRSKVVASGGLTLRCHVRLDNNCQCIMIVPGYMYIGHVVYMLTNTATLSPDYFDCHKWLRTFTTVAVFVAKEAGQRNNIWTRTYNSVHNMYHLHQNDCLAPGDKNRFL